MIGVTTLARGNLISPEQKAQLMWQLWAVEMFIKSHTTVPDNILRRACFPDLGHGIFRETDNVGTADSKPFSPPICDARLLLSSYANSGVA